jgi:glycosyltransferase involved in cell wall biosynthesis
VHILFLTDNFPPEVNAPASRTFEHCRLWVESGHRVTVITCAPNFPDGRVFDGYSNRLWQKETMRGIDVIRVWSYITANSGFVRRVLDYMSFMFSASLASVFVRRVDIVIGTSPQFFVACAGHIVGVLKRKPFIFELRDLWPESIKAVGAMRNSTILLLIEKLELYLYRRASRIVSLTYSFRHNLAARGIDPLKVSVVTNGVDLSRFWPRPKDTSLEAELGLAGKFVAGYVGTHGMAHALETLLDAAQILLESSDRDRFSIVLIGNGARKSYLRSEAARRGLSNIRFIDSVPKEQVTRYWSLLDISIIHLIRSATFETVIPSKLFESMGMGIPVLHGVHGESAEMVARERVGIVFQPQNPHSLVAGLRRFEADHSLMESCRLSCQSAAQRFDRRVLARSMLTILEETVSKTHSGISDH